MFKNSRNSWLLSLLIVTILSACDDNNPSTDNDTDSSFPSDSSSSNDSNDTHNGETDTDSFEENTYPIGPVVQCSGECPLGECSGKKTCEELYDTNLDENSQYCLPNQTANYCIITEPDYFNTYRAVVNCEVGVARIELCQSSCGNFMTGGKYKCDI
jgi:hypothetical protein